MDAYMKKAVEEAYVGITSDDGEPFGAIIVCDGKVIATGHNEVIASHDPTAHAEIVAIRKACLLLESIDLSNCTLYTTCEPCPMCLGAILWAKIPTVYYVATRNDASRIGFDDNYLYDIISGKLTDTSFEIKSLDRSECLKVLEDYEKAIGN